MGFDRVNSKSKTSSTNFPSVGTWNPRTRLFRGTIIILPYHSQHHFSSFSSSVRSILFEHLRSQPHQPICFRLVAQLYNPQKGIEMLNPPCWPQKFLLKNLRRLCSLQVLTMLHALREVCALVEPPRWLGSVGDDVLPIYMPGMLS